jgi:hypothetical protein
MKARDRSGRRGIALPLVLFLLLVVSLSFTLVMDRTVAEIPQVAGFYYDNVALDLAEDGVVIAGQRLAAGGGAPASLALGEFRGLQGSVAVQTEPLGSGQYRVTAVGVLSGPDGRERYSRRVSAVGAAAGGKFTVKQWDE